MRGLARGIGSKDHVSSPSFKLSNIYKGKKITLNHFDFYRLEDAGLMEYGLSEITSDESQVLVVEWAEIVKNVLPDNRLKISLTAKSENERQVEFSYPKDLSYLLRGIK